MRRLVVYEHTRIERGGSRRDDRAGDAPVSLEAHLYDRLRSFDGERCGEGDRVFEWSDGYARTTQWVGVVQVPGIQIEILPKIDALGVAVASDEVEASWEARRNLIYMLSVSGDVPVRSRDVARLGSRHASLSETLGALFAARLRRELLRGPERAYLEHADNLRRFKGKLLVSHHVLHNAAHRERFFCGYDELTVDTRMNRIFRASCRLLLELTSRPATQDSLRQCMLLLEGVSDVEVQEADFSRITINRQNERFEDVLRFCRLLLAGRAPTAEAGGTRTFSLLFDMNAVFERFVASYVRRYVAPRVEGLEVRAQAAGHKRHLLESEGTGVLQLAPDLLLEAPGDRRLVMDTKWKLLAAGKRGRSGVSESDLYQLHAYVRRFGCQRSILLYPHVTGLEPRDFDILDADGLRRERVAVRHVRLRRNLHLESERTALTAELEEIVREGLCLESRI